MEIPTEFAPAQRFPLEIVHKQAGMLNSIPILPSVLNTMLNYVLILNENRQIVFATQNIHQIAQGKNNGEILGLRPGEALGCIHSCETEGGCGTTKFCSECGAVKSILNALAGYKDMQECRIIRYIGNIPEALELLVYSTPFNYNGEKFTIVCIADISNAKRRRMMEQVFYHDILNSAGGLQALLTELKEELPDALLEDMELAISAANEIVDTILFQREVMLAENNELIVNPSIVSAKEVLSTTAGLFRNQPVAHNRSIVVSQDSDDFSFETDHTLLKRVLYNLIKNALEAIPPGDKVTIGAKCENNNARFYVHNPGVIPNNVQLQIFNRSFSTKGQGRGLGMYSVKLFTEGYLKGKCCFTSDAENGTTFYIILPLFWSATY